MHTHRASWLYWVGMGVFWGLEGGSGLWGGTTGSGCCLCPWPSWSSGTEVMLRGWFIASCVWLSCCSPITVFISAQFIDDVEFFFPPGDRSVVEYRRRVGWRRWRAVVPHWPTP